MDQYVEQKSISNIQHCLITTGRYWSCIQSKTEGFRTWLLPRDQPNFCILVVCMFTCFYHDKLMLTWCFVAGILLAPLRDTSEGSPQWQSAESHWMSAHPWVIAGHWPWLPSNQPLSSRKRGILCLRGWSRGLLQERWAVGFQGSSQKPTLLQFRVYKITINSTLWEKKLVDYLHLSSVSGRFQSCQRNQR